MSESESPGRQPQITTGNRREERHFERDDDQMVRVAHLATPQAPLARHETTTGAGQGPEKPGEPTEDVKVDVAESSVWDARPPEDRAFQDVPTSGPAQSSPLNDGHEPGAEPRDHKPPFPPSELVSKRAGG